MSTAALLAEPLAPNAPPATVHPLQTGARPAFSPGAPAPPARTKLAPLSHPLSRSLAGLAGLGLAAGLAGQNDALASAPAGLMSGAGVLLLTSPALVVGHQFLRMQASPKQLIGALWDGFTRAGVTALGAVPAVAFVAATSNMGPALGLIGVWAAGGLGLLHTIRNLGEAERDAGGEIASGTGIAMLWAGLATLIGLRLLAIFTF